jgi:hypothetical protein
MTWVCKIVSIAYRACDHLLKVLTGHPDTVWRAVGIYQLALMPTVEPILRALIERVRLE